MNKKLANVLYLGFLAALPIITFDIYQPALPAITQYFHTSQALGQLTLSLFFFLLGFSQLIWGPLIDHFGRRPTLFASLNCFFIATLVCIFAQSIWILILGRILQGFSICCANVLAFSSSRDIEDSTERAKLMSHVSMVISVSPIFAPVAGSLIFAAYGWDAIFVFVLALSILLLIISKFFLKESIHWTEASHKFSIKKSFVNYREIIKDKIFLNATFIVTSSFTATLIVIVNAAYIIIDNLHYSPQLFGVIFACNGLVVIGGNYIGIALRNYRSLVWNIRLGALTMVAGALTAFLFIQFLGLSLSTLAPFLIVNLGTIFLSAPSYSLALAHFTKTAGSATAFLSMVRMSISALIAALISTLMSHGILVFTTAILVCALACFCASLFLTKNVNWQSNALNN